MMWIKCYKQGNQNQLTRIHFSSIYREYHGRVVEQITSTFNSPHKRLNAQKMLGQKPFCTFPNSTNKTMGGIFSTPANTSSQSAEALARFDGLGLKPRPLGLPLPTPQSRAKLSQLLRANHLFYATLWNNRRFHNHNVHALSSAYFLGADSTTLYNMYESLSERLAKWEEDSPAEVTDEDWFELVGNKAYERGFHDYFDEKITDSLSFDWRKIVREFVVNPEGPSNPKLMLESMFGGLLHPLIHMGYAVELDDWEVASEALTLCAGCRADESRRLLKLTPFGEPKGKVNQLLDILKEIRNDSTFDGLYKLPSEGKIVELVANFPEKLSDYTNRFAIGSTHEELIANLKELFATAALILAATHRNEATELPAYDFFLLHLFTATHAAIEIIDKPLEGAHDPILTVELEHDVIQNLWLTFVILYIIQMRPSIDITRITNPANRTTIPQSTGKLSEFQDPNDAAWANIHKFLFPPECHDFDDHVIKAVRGFLFASRYLDNASLGLPETTKDGFDFFTQCAYIHAYSMQNQSLVGRERSKVTLDIKP